MKRIKVRLRKNSWIIFVVALFAWFIPTTNANAENTFGINTSVYNNWTEWNEYNSSPPIPPITPLVGEFVSPRIENYFDSQPIFNLWDDFIIKFEGNIISPCTCLIQLLALADDGTQLYLDNNLITSDWYDKGSGGTLSEPIQFNEGVSKHIVLWFYENGGGAWVQLWWLVNNEWSIVPDSAFILNEINTTTTTTELIETSTTTVETTTTLQNIETTTTVQIPTTTVPKTTTTILNPPTTSTTILSTTTTTTPTTTTTIPDKPNLIQPINDNDVNKIIDDLSNSKITPSELISIIDESDLSEENLQKIIDNIIVNEITNSIAQQLATSNAVINSIDTDQATQIFESIQISELSDEEKIAIEQSITNAPIEIKKTFENTINIFASGLDGYVPSGSKVDVKTRRIIIAATAAVSTITISGTGLQGGGTTPTPSGSSNNSGNSNSDNSGRRRRK